MQVVFDASTEMTVPNWRDVQAPGDKIIELHGHYILYTIAIWQITGVYQELLPSSKSIDNHGKRQGTMVIHGRFLSNPQKGRKGVKPGWSFDDSFTS